MKLIVIAIAMLIFGCMAWAGLCGTHHEACKPEDKERT
jgi:hypothetical protein